MHLCFDDTRRTVIAIRCDYTYVHSIRGVGYRFEPVPKKTSSQALPRAVSI
jgi:hypothetical protein